MGDLGRGLRQSSEFRTGGQGISDQQQPAFFRMISRCGAVEKAKRTGVGEGDVFDPVVRLGIGREQGFEIEGVQAAVRDNEDLGALGNQRTRRLHQHLVKRKAVGILRLGKIPGCFESLAVSPHGGIDLGGRRQIEPADFLRSDDPQVRLLGTQKVVEDGAAGAARDSWCIEHGGQH